MLSLIANRAARTSAVTASPSHRQSSRGPRMRSSPRSALAVQWTARAGYYFDAAWHGSQTLRQLIKAAHSGETLGLLPPQQLLAMTMEVMLGSICPGLPDDRDSLDCFQRLLQMHLSALTARELKQLAQALKAQRFDHVVVESVVDDEMVSEYGFANGPPHCRQRTLMFTKDLHLALEEALDAAASSEAALDGATRLTPSQAQQARDVLAALAGLHAGQGITPVGLVSAANQLASATGTALIVETATEAQPASAASKVSWQQGQLIVEQDTLAALNEPGSDTLLASLLRDLLELTLAHKRFGTSTELAKLPARQRALLMHDIEQVLSRAPTVTDDTLRERAAGIVAQTASFGTMQVIPTVGSVLGHVWISPVLSVVPDKSRKGVEAGKRFMHSGSRLEPTHCTINEWDLRWLSPRENEELYPATKAWHLNVPAHWLKLQQAAEDTRLEWQQQKLPYRFVGTRPGMPATGCRVTVGHAVQRAMDEDARELFGFFNRGLPEPDSPTELALRMRRFMAWLGEMGGGPAGERGDL